MANKFIFEYFFKSYNIKISFDNNIENAFAL